MVGSGGENVFTPYVREYSVLGADAGSPFLSLGFTRCTSALRSFSPCNEIYSVTTNGKEAKVFLHAIDNRLKTLNVMLLLVSFFFISFSVSLSL